MSVWQTATEIDLFSLENYVNENLCPHLEHSKHNKYKWTWNRTHHARIITKDVTDHYAGFSWLSAQNETLITITSHFCCDKWSNYSDIYRWAKAPIVNKWYVSNVEILRCKYTYNIHIKYSDDDRYTNSFLQFSAKVWQRIIFDEKSLQSWEPKW